MFNCCVQCGDPTPSNIADLEFLCDGCIEMLLDSGEDA